MSHSRYVFIQVNIMEWFVMEEIIAMSIGERNRKAFIKLSQYTIKNFSYGFMQTPILLLNPSPVWCVYTKVL